MLIRLLLALLLAAFAVPAAAAEPACHGDGVAMAMAHHDAPARPDPAPAPHGCVGCVPIADWLGERVAAPIVPPSLSPVSRAVTLDIGRDGPPALPPPRQG